MWKQIAKGLKQNFGFVATLIGFVVDTITLAALINSKVAPTIPFIDQPLGVSTQLLIWIVALLTYLGSLREYWLGMSRRLSNRPAETFGRFLLNDMFLAFKHPFLAIPFVLLVGLLITIISQVDSSLAGVLLFFGAGGVIFAYVVLGQDIRNERRRENEWEAINDDKSFGHWKLRIQRELDRAGYVTDVALSNLYPASRSLCEKAMERYQYVFESDRDLVLILEQIEDFTDKSELPRLLWVLTTRDLVDSRPWMENSSGS